MFVLVVVCVCVVVVVLCLLLCASGVLCWALSFDRVLLLVLFVLEGVIVCRLCCVCLLILLCVLLMCAFVVYCTCYVVVFCLILFVYVCSLLYYLYWFFGVSFSVCVFLFVVVLC